MIIRYLFAFFSKAFSVLICLTPCIAKASVVEYNLVIAEQAILISSEKRKAMTINGSVPGPTLEFQVGDTARINVRNEMNVSTSIHWHGILLPNREDGVPYLTTPPIKPHTTYTYEFPIKHHGTYWYHSHTGLQEQRGVYGSIVISPQKQRFHPTHDEVIVLSDWTHEDPNSVLRTLKAGRHYYAYKKGQTQHLVGALKNKALSSYLKRSWSRMNPMDLSDVAYDAFLSNGRVEHRIAAAPGETLRLRLVNAGASTYFFLQYANGPMQVIANDGVDLQPFESDRLLMAIAETYDVLVTVPENGMAEFRATAQDGSGYTSTWIGSGDKRISAPDIPGPDLYRLHGDHEEMGHHHHHHGQMGEKERPDPPYEKLKAVQETAFDNGRPWKEVHLDLTGDMTRYIWSFNGKVLHEEDKIEVEKGQNVRFIMKNKTMMHHPIHLHGHFFRVLNRHGKYAPLKHTVDVPPLGERVIEFEATEDKDWLFHCHVLYHMKAGMTRIVHYKGSTPDADLAPMRNLLFSNPWYFWGDGQFLSQLSTGHLQASNTRNDLLLDWESNYRKGYEIVGSYQRYWSANFKTFGGILSSDVDQIVGIFGISYILPFLIEASIWTDTELDYRISAEQHIPISRHLTAVGELEYDRESKLEWNAGGEIFIHRNFSLKGEYHSEYGAGGGVSVRF